MLVNATPVGSAARLDETPVPAERAPARHAWCFDMVYDPIETRLLREARARRLHRRSTASRCWWRRPSAQFETWTGVEAPIGR